MPYITRTKINFFLSGSLFSSHDSIRGMKTQTNKNRPKKVKTSSKNKSNNEAVSAAGATNRRRQPDTQPESSSTKKGGKRLSAPPQK
jgi:hypothetical protein